MKYPTHSIYELFFEMDDKEVVIYRGYVYDRDPQERLVEHLAEHKYFTQEQLTTFGYKHAGKFPLKNQMIIELQESGIEIKVRTVVTLPSYEQLDEEWYIQQAKNDGHPITNVARGGVWQKHVLVKGVLLETDNSTSNAEINSNIQDFKLKQKNKPKGPMPEPVLLDQDDFEAWIDRLWESQLRFNKRQGKWAPVITRSDIYHQNRHLLKV